MKYFVSFLLLVGILFADDVNKAFDALNKQDYLKAVELFKKACDGGETSGCYNLGLMYENKEGVKQDYVKAAKLFEKACNGGEASGCYALAVMRQDGEGIKQDYVKAAELFKKACDGGHAIGCGILGIIYLNGKGVKQDYSKAEESFKKACNDEDTSGCTGLGLMYTKGEGVKQDYVKAAKLFEKACNGGEASGCFGLGHLHYNGQGVMRDKSKAKQFFGKACDMGMQLGCENYEKLNKRTSSSREDKSFEGEIIVGEYIVFATPEIFIEYEERIDSKREPAQQIIDDLQNRNQICYLKENSQFYAVTIEENQNAVVVVDRSNGCQGLTYSIYFANPDYIKITRMGKKVSLPSMKNTEEQLMDYYNSLSAEILAIEIHSEIVKSLPVMVDKMTQISSAFVAGNLITVAKRLIPSDEESEKIYNYAIGSQRLEFGSEMKKGDTNFACSEELIKVFFDKGGQIRYIYWTENSKKIFEHTIGKMDCTD